MVFPTTKHCPDDLGELDHGDRIVVGDRTVVEAREPLRELVEPPELGVVVLYLARRQLREGLHLDLVDHRVEDLLALPVARADEDGDDHALPVLRRLVAKPDRDGLAAGAQLVRHDRGIEVQGEGRHSARV